MYELYALQKYLNIVEDQIEFIKSQKEIQFRQWLKRERPDIDTYQEEERDHFSLINQVFPRYFRYSLVVSLWAVYEIAIKELSEYVASNKNVHESINDGKNSIIDRSERYFKNDIRFQLYGESKTSNRLRDIYYIRNIIAHSNGVVNLSNKKILKRWGVISSANGGIFLENGVLVIEKEFLKNTYDLIRETLYSLVNRVRNEWPTAKRRNAE